MHSINDSLKDISITKLLILAIILLVVSIVLEDIFPITIPTEVIFIGLLLYIVYKLRDCKDAFKMGVSKVFTNSLLKSIVLVVIFNIFFSYGMIYLTNILIGVFPQLNSIVYTTMASNTTLIFIGSLISSIIIAPLFEELIFRGIILNKLSDRFTIHTAVLVSSILFGICHSFGGMFSAFVFGVCMSILYLKTLNIMVPIIAHGLNNLFSEIIVGVDVNGMIFTNPIIIAIFSILAIISALILFISIKQEWRKLH